jgi:carbon storage regulator
MLVLSRQRDESIVIGTKLGEVRVTIVDIRGDKVRLGIDAPVEVPVHRREVFEAIKREQERPSRLEKKAEQSPPPETNVQQYPSNVQLNKPYNIQIKDY